eukprot:TRINITY_DN57959_c0_g4_i2.p3 TRINITY_DN57959_c0_g4~~TRINITY_DN57959_c0_g4_i2.p3  ORF type:complete len:128 (-),score=10.19 TRINITY_DN57959_c0_g4_i2:198-581(-)
MVSDSQKTISRWATITLDQMLCCNQEQKKEEEGKNDIEELKIVYNLSVLILNLTHHFLQNDLAKRILLEYVVVNGYQGKNRVHRELFKSCKFWLFFQDSIVQGFCGRVKSLGLQVLTKLITLQVNHC